METALKIPLSEKVWITREEAAAILNVSLPYFDDVIRESVEFIKAKAEIPTGSERLVRFSRENVIKYGNRVGW